MRIDFDPEKSNKNVCERNLSFDEAINFNWETAISYEDNRKPYTERRNISMGYLNNRLHVICFTPIKDGIRIISFRKANQREVKKYEKETVNRQRGKRSGTDS